jgi:CubicO group peptidase (beta-lactamase class C family)
VVCGRRLGGPGAGARVTSDTVFQLASVSKTTTCAGIMALVEDGVDFDELCKQRVFAPLGMTDTGFRLADIETSNLAMPYATVSQGELEPIFHYGYPDYPDGALRTSAVHLARWLGAFMNFGAFDGPGCSTSPRSAR